MSRELIDFGTGNPVTEVHHQMLDEFTVFVLPCSALGKRKFDRSFVTTEVAADDQERDRVASLKSNAAPKCELRSDRAHSDAELGSPMCLRTSPRYVGMLRTANAWPSNSGFGFDMTL